MLIFILGSGTVQASLDEELFPVPAIIENNVQFWQEIYTKISLSQGLLHDRDYPLIIYDTLDIGDLWGRELERYLDRNREKYKNLIKEITSRPEHGLNAEQKRILGLFKLYASKEALKGAEERIRFQQGQRERFLAGIERSGAYLDTIRSIFRELEIPQLLCFLPHVESSFDYRAYSKVGAAGLWQFMPYTARQYMRVDSYIDERRDPVISTRAAGLYLKSAYKVLGSWPLALSAYNHGPAGIMRAVEATGSSDLGIIIQKYESASFQFASKNFYSCFVAASRIAMRPEFFFDTIRYEQKKFFFDIRLDYSLTAGQIASILGIPAEQIAEHNPAIMPEIYEKGMPIPAGYLLHIESSHSLQKIKLAALSAPDSLYKRTPTYGQKRYVVNRGETLSHIARKTGLSVEEIKNLNGIRSSFIRAGDVLRISVRYEPMGNEKTSIDYMEILRVKENGEPQTSDATY